MNDLENSDYINYISITIRYNRFNQKILICSFFVFQCKFKIEI